MTNKNEKVEVKIGQIWQRNEYLGGEPLPNQGFVKVIDVAGERALIQACLMDGRTFKVTGRLAQIKRFGRRGGYRLHRDV